MNRWTPPFSTYFRCCPVDPAFSTWVNVNEHKAFYQLWMIELRERERDSCVRLPFPTLKQQAWSQVCLGLIASMGHSQTIPLEPDPAPGNQTLKMQSRHLPWLRKTGFGCCSRGEQAALVQLIEDLLLGKWLNHLA